MVMKIINPCRRNAGVLRFSTFGVFDNFLFDSAKDLNPPAVRNNLCLIWLV